VISGFAFLVTQALSFRAASAVRVNNRWHEQRNTQPEFYIKAIGGATGAATPAAT
jgi:hypothetical protein